VIKDFGAKVPKSKFERMKDAQEAAKDKKSPPPSEYGAHTIHLSMKIPTKLSPKEKELYEALSKLEPKPMDRIVDDFGFEKEEKSYDLHLRDSREYQEFIKVLDSWRKKQEDDMVINVEGDKIPNHKSVNNQFKKKLAGAK